MTYPCENMFFQLHTYREANPKRGTGTLVSQKKHWGGFRVGGGGRSYNWGGGGGGGSSNEGHDPAPPRARPRVRWVSWDVRQLGCAWGGRS